MTRRFLIVLMVTLTASCGGAGSGNPGAGDPGGGGPPPSGGARLHPPVLFVINDSARTISAFENPSQLSGDVAPAAVLAGDKTQLSDPFGLTVTSAGDLIVRDGNRLLRFADILGGLGNRAPSSVVTGGRTGVGRAGGIARSLISDTLFVGEGSAIAAFDGASTAGFSGDLPPNRAITSAFNLFSASAMVANARDTLFVIDTDGETGWAFDSASAANGNIDRPHQIGGFEIPTDVAIGGDVLFVIDTERNSSLIAYDVSDGEIRFSHSAEIAGSTQISGLAIDAAGNAYLSDPTLSVIYVVKNFTNRHGDLTPAATIGGSHTTLGRPSELFLLE